MASNVRHIARPHRMSPLAWLGAIVAAIAVVAALNRPPRVERRPSPAPAHVSWVTLFREQDQRGRNDPVVIRSFVKREPAP
jgi:hypothetical protein